MAKAPSSAAVAPALLERAGAAEWHSAYVARKPVSDRVSAASPSAEDLAILRAVLYASVFDYPLSVSELRRTLPKVTSTTDAIRRAIAERPFLRERLNLIGEWCVPAGRHDLVERRREREAASRQFLSAHRRTLDMICALPFTRLVAISGSLAHLNVDDDADLDLFVITRGPRVWTVALMLIVLSRLMKRRKAVCANFLLSDSQLALDQHDLYTASQALHLRPVSGADTQARFMAANPFVQEWFPNAADEPPAPFPLPPAGSMRRLKPVIEALLWMPSGVIEAACRATYGWHLRRKVAGWHSPEQVRLERACMKLHTNSHRTAVLDRLETLVAEAVGPTATGRRPGGAC